MIAFQSINVFQLKISTLSCLATIARQDRIMNIYYYLLFYDFIYFLLFIKL